MIKLSNRHFGSLCGLAVLILFGATAIAQSLIEVEASVDKANMRIGDQIVYSLKIDRDADLTIKSPGQGANLGMFEIKDYEIHDPIERDGRIVEQYDYTISVFDTGSYVIPPFPIGYLTSDTTTQYQFITSEPLEVTVASIVNDPNADIKDIKPLFDIPAEYWPWIIGSLLLLALGLAGYFWWRRKNGAGEPVFRKEIIRPAHEIALEELAQLEGRGLLGKEQHKLFYTELSDILRRYYEGRFFINAMEATSSELVDILESEGIDAESVRYTEGALNNCDLVKFAKYVPSPQESGTTVDLVRRIIERTRLEFAAVEHVEEVKEENQITG